MVSHTSLMLCSLFFNLFPFCSLDSIISIVLPLSLLILYCACSKLSLIAASTFFISVVLFNSGISFWYLFMFLSLYCYFYVFICCFIDFLHIFLFLHIFKMVILKCLPSRSIIKSFSGQGFVDLYFPLTVLYSCFFVCLVAFVVVAENWTYEPNMLALEIS